jgi:hypothetical protein
MYAAFEPAHRHYDPAVEVALQQEDNLLVQDPQEWSCRQVSCI